MDNEIYLCCAYALTIGALLILWKKFDNWLKKIWQKHHVDVKPTYIMTFIIVYGIDVAKEPAATLLEGCWVIMSWAFCRLTFYKDKVSISFTATNLKQLSLGTVAPGVSIPKYRTILLWLQ